MGRLQLWRPLLRWGAGIGVAGLLSIGAALAREAAPLPGTVPLAQLPVEARTVHRLILAGGPFARAKDGIVFANRERILPAEARGFYREYTVATPGASDRGARRMVCGGQQPAAPIACYYTADHYATFRRVTT
ncbi:MAG: ribonuclease domain-containing protein [Caldimonas sp.]